MQAVVPAAGEGTRLRPLTEDRPKGLVEVHGRPLLAYVFDALRELGVDRSVVVVGYEGEQIPERFGDRYRDMALEYVTQAERRGLAHAVAQADGRIDGDFLVLNGDNVFLDPVEDIQSAVDAERADGALLVETGDPESVASGGEVRTADGEITRVVEKPHDPDGALMTTGCYYLPETAMEACRRIEPSERGEYELADAINDLIDRGFSFVPVQYAGWRRNVNTPEDIEAVERKLT